MMASVAALFSPLAIAPATAFDFFGLPGSEEDAPPPSPETLPYKLEITGVDDDKALAQNLKDASNVWRLRLQAPASGAGLTRRVVGDFPNLANALWPAAISTPRSRRRQPAWRFIPMGAELTRLQRGRRVSQ